LLHFDSHHDKEIRKYIKTYCETSPFLFYPYFKKLINPIEARYFEDKVAAYLETAVEKDTMKSVYRFTLKNRSKFFNRFENLLLSDLVDLSTQNPQNDIFTYPSPGRLIRPNVIANRSARGRFETVVLSIPEEIGIMLLH
jgi:hypothetical protein